jgi:hypothetical protein
MGLSVTRITTFWDLICPFARQTQRIDARPDCVGPFTNQAHNLVEAEFLKRCNASGGLSQVKTS